MVFDVGGLCVVCCWCLICWCIVGDCDGYGYCDGVGLIVVYFVVEVVCVDIGVGS